MKLPIVCQGNICPSPAAHYLLKKMLAEEGNDTIQIESAGLLKESSGRNIHPKIARGLKWFGCEASGHQSVFIGDKKLEEYSYLFTSVSNTETALSVADSIYTKKYWQTVHRIHRLSKAWVAFLKE